MVDKKLQGKRNRAAGLRFERKVRLDLESKGWILSKWMNNVEFKDSEWHGTLPNWFGNLVPAKHKFCGVGRPMAIGTGFPDFIAYKIIKPFVEDQDGLRYKIKKSSKFYEIIFVECKSNGYLSKEEKEKARWYLEKNFCAKFLIAKKGKKRGEIEYIDYGKKLSEKKKK